MITPSYSVTATERVLPRMALDFTTGTLDPRVTVTRALNTATRVNASGFIETVNANLPRFDYNPATLAPKGLLIEESRRNIINFATAIGSWTINPGVTVVDNDTLSPTGSQNASTISVALGLNGAYMLAPATNATVYTFSAYVKYVSGNSNIYVGNGLSPASAMIYVDLSTGTITSSDPAISNPNIAPFKDGWYRVSGTFTSTGTTIAAVAGTVNGGKFGIWGVDIEAGAFPTSVILTSGSGLTRNNDIVSMTGTNFSDWYNANGGSFVFEGSALSTLGFAYLVLASDNTNTNRFGAYKSGAAVSGFVASSGGTQMEITGSSIVANVPFKMAVAAQANSGNFSFNGSIGTNDTTLVMPTVNQLTIGSFQNVSPLNGHARAVRYYLPRLINAELQAFSK